jgi:hemerythrin
LGNAAREHMHDEDSILREIDASIRKPSAKGRSKRFLKAVTDAALTAHIAEHANLMREFDALAKKLQIARSIPHSELCADIKAWFLDHAIKHDAHIKTIFQSM